MSQRAMRIFDGAQGIGGSAAESWGNVWRRLRGGSGSAHKPLY
jgi:hypothetical protein